MNHEVCHHAVSWLSPCLLSALLMIRIMHAFCICSEIKWLTFVSTINLNIPVTPPAQRVQFILGEDVDDGMHEPHPLFTEMGHLVHDGNEMEWRETARYIVLIVRDMLNISVPQTASVLWGTSRTVPYNALWSPASKPYHVDGSLMGVTTCSCHCFRQTDSLFQVRSLIRLPWRWKLYVSPKNW